MSILATDISTRVLRTAGAAEWPIQKARTIPQHLLRRHFLRGIGPHDGLFTATPQLRSMLRFARLNLHRTGEMTSLTRFDAIFCRNVLIYFDRQSKARIVEALIDRLAPGGFLFVGHAESLATVTDRVQCIEPTVYTRATA